MNEPWSAQWIGQQPGDTFHPVFEKRVRVAGPLGKARLYICGLGLYEAYIGGRKGRGRIAHALRERIPLCLAGADL